MTFWTCQGCGTTFDQGDPDAITSHVRDCPLVDGAAQPLFGPAARCPHCGRPGTLAIRQTWRNQEIVPVTGFGAPSGTAIPCLPGEPAEQEEAEITGQALFCRACHHHTGPPDGYMFTTGDGTTITSRAAGSAANTIHQTAQVLSGPVSERRNRAITRYREAVSIFTEEIIAVTSTRVRAALPGAAWLETFGFYNEDNELKMQPLRVFDATDTLLADAENTASDADHTFARLAGEISLDLDWLGQINGDDYLGPQRIDLT